MEQARRLDRSLQHRRIFNAALALAILALAAFAWNAAAATNRLVISGAALMLLAWWLLRATRFRLFGPLLWYDMVRTGRRQHVRLRIAYACILLLVLLTFYGSLAILLKEHEQEHLRPNEVAELSLAAFLTITAMQLALVMLFTPAYTAGAIAAEKERGLLPALLATPTGNHEIVFSLFASRLGNLALLILTSLPVLSMLEFMGGLDPDFVLAAFTMTILTMLGLGALGIALSVECRDAQKATLLTYAVAAIYLAASGLIGWLVTVVASRQPLASEIAAVLGAGNVFVAIADIVSGTSAGQSLKPLLWDAVFNFAWFHLALTCICLVWASVRVRRRVLSVAGEAIGRRGAAVGAQSALRLDVLLDRWPMLWKEFVLRSGVSRGLWRQLGAGFVLTLALLPIVHTWYWFGRPWPPTEGCCAVLRTIISGITVTVGTAMLLGVAIRSAKSISGERRNRTFEGILITPISRGEFLCSKWLGNLFQPHRGWLVIGLLWAIGIVTGAMKPMGMVGSVVVWLCYAAVTAAIGLYWSAFFRDSVRAMVATLFALVVISFSLLQFSLSIQFSLDATPVRPSVKLNPAPFGILPPVAMWRLLIRDGAPGTLPHIFIGCAGWMAAAAGFAFLTRSRYVVISGDKKRQEMARASVQDILRTEEQDPRNSAILYERPWTIKRISAPLLTSVFSVRWLAAARGAALALIPVTVMLVLYQKKAAECDENLRAAIAEADHQDSPWRLEELEAARKTCPPDKNAAQRILAAHEKLPPAPPPWFDDEIDNTISALAIERQLAPAFTRRLRERLSRLEAALHQVRAVADMPGGRFPISYPDDLTSLRLPHCQIARELACLLRADAFLRAQDGDINGALRSCQAIVNIAGSFGDEPLVVYQLVRCGTRGLGFQATARVLAQGQASAAALQSLQQAVQAESRPSILLTAMRGDRADGFRTLPFTIERRSRSDFLAEPQSLARALWSPPMPQQRASLLRFENQEVEVAKLPDHLQRKHFAKLAGGPPDQLLQDYISVTRLAGTEYRWLAYSRTLSTALAAERYRITRGHWPGSLHRLVPDFLETVPLDPYDGMPLRMRKLTNGLTIYSVGSNLVDDGGKIRRPAGAVEPLDVGIRLWNPDKRRQTPGPQL
jgi:ABC-type transport system involved in multi-copper enzyme maturation permease subunit